MAEAQRCRTAAADAGPPSLEATVLFADIRGFSAIAEALGPQATVRLLNDHFARAAACIEAEGGRADSFVADAMMAVFAGPGDADRAVRAAVGLVRDLEVANATPQRRGLPPLALGIGIHTGAVVAAGIGPPHRRSPTVIGSGANLAFRLERACRVYDAGILISDATRRRLAGRYRWRPIDRLADAGGGRPLVVCEVLDQHTEASFPALDAVLGHYRAGLAAYRRGRPRAALAAFERALGLHPGDGPSRLYRQRCRAALAAVPSLRHG